MHFQEVQLACSLTVVIQTTDEQPCVQLNRPAFHTEVYLWIQVHWDKNFLIDVYYTRLNCVQNSSHGTSDLNSEVKDTLDDEWAGLWTNQIIFDEKLWHWFHFGVNAQLCFFLRCTNINVKLDSDCVSTSPDCMTVEKKKGEKKAVRAKYDNGIHVCNFAAKSTFCTIVRIINQIWIALFFVSTSKYA